MATKPEIRDWLADPSFQTRVRRYAERHVESRHMASADIAAEAVQDAMAKVLSGDPNRFESKQHFFTCTCRAVRWAFADGARKRIRSREITRGLEQVAAQVANELEESGDGETWRSLGEVFGSLDGETQALISDHLEGLSASAIARKLGVHCGTVRRRYQRAVETIRKRLGL